MKAFRCQKCHRVWKEEQLNHENGIKICCDVQCGGMVFDVTHTRVGEKFMARQNAQVSNDIALTFMNKKMNVSYQGENS